MKVNALDLSPNFAGTLMGITNGIGALTGIAAVSFFYQKMMKRFVYNNAIIYSRTLLAC
jgi:hypothetical protein